MDITIVLNFGTPTISGYGLASFLDDLDDYVNGDTVITVLHQALSIQAELDIENYGQEEALSDIEGLACIRLKDCQVTILHY